MKKFCSIMFMFAFLIFGLMPAFCGPALALEDAIIAVVNEDIITLKDLKNFLIASYKQLETSIVSEKELQSAAKDLEENGIERLIDDRLILSAAKAKGYEAKPAAVTGRLTEIQAKYPSEAVFLSALAKDGLSITDLRQQISNQLITKYFLEQEIKAKIFVTPQEVTQYYHDHILDFTKPERINLDSIFIPYEGEDRSSAQLKAEQASERVKSGENFRSVANEFSTLPSLGTIAKGELLPDLEKELFKLDINQVSDPIESEKGIFIVKMLGKTEKETASLEDVRNKISNFLQSTKFKEELQRWIEKERKKAYIEIKQP